jgi:hypothetical protein
MLFACALALATASCISAYAPLSNAPTAKLMLTTTVRGAQGGSAFDGSFCGTESALEARNENHWIDISADRPFFMVRHFSSEGLPYGRLCRRAVTFTPSAGVSYVADFTRDAAGCNIAIYRLNEAGQRVPEPRTQQLNARPKCL